MIKHLPFYLLGVEVTKNYSIFSNTLHVERKGLAEDESNGELAEHVKQDDRVSCGLDRDRD